jgi:hypothetical protein
MQLDMATQLAESYWNGTCEMATDGPGSRINVVEEACSSFVTGPLVTAALFVTATSMQQIRVLESITKPCEREVLLQLS